MIKRNKNILSLVLVCALVVVAVFGSISLISKVKPIEECTADVPDMMGESTEGLYKISITDIVRSGKITKINYLPDEFADPLKPIKGGQVVNLENKNFHFASRGTLQIVVLGPNPMSPTFSKDIECLKQFEKGGNWNLTLCLPPIFSACNIFAQNKNVASIGEIEDYNFIEFNDFDNTYTEFHSSKTALSYVDLQFYTRRESMMPFITANNLVTIHYESKTGGVCGIKNCPVIGVKTAVINSTSLASKLYTVIATLSGVIFLLFLYISLIKRDTRPLPSLFIMLFISLVFTCKLLLSTVVSVPVFLEIFCNSVLVLCVFVLTLPFLSLVKNKTANLIVGLVAITITAIDVMLYFFDFATGFVVNQVVHITLIAIIAFSIGSLIYISIKKPNNIYNYPVLLLTGIVLFSNSLISLLRKNISSLDVNYFVILLIVIITFAFCLRLFLNTERENKNLTENLKTEVDIRTKELTKALGDRNEILQFISHDLRKPVNFYNNALLKIRAKEGNEDNIKLIDEILKKNRETDNSLKKIAEFSHINFLDENLSVINLKDFVSEIFNSVKPDCDASGVLIENKVCAVTKVYAKSHGLSSALLNIIFNALEHSQCSKITILQKDNTIIIADDGKGIILPENVDIFQPYISSYTQGINNGLGLYICKQAITSMNGTISYTSDKNGTSFFITLPKFL